jgi:hypothetical protein
MGITTRRRKGEDGATLVEAAIILPVLILIIVTIMELGLAFKDFLTTDFAAKEGARVGALAGNDVDADCDIIQAIVAGYSATDFDDLQGITIFEVNPSGAPMGGTSNTWTFPNNPSDDPSDCADWNQSAPGAWPPAARDVLVGGGADLDIIGITIDTQHDWITGVPPWRGRMNIIRTAIQRLEPEGFE